MGKGSRQRPVDRDRFNDNFDRIFGGGVMNKYNLTDNWPELSLSIDQTQVLQFISLALYANGESPIDENEVADLLRTNNCTIEELVACGGLIKV